MDSELLNQEEFNDLLRDLCFLKDKAEHLGSWLKSRNLLSPGITFSRYRYRYHEIELFQYFEEEINLVYYNNIQEPMAYFEIMKQPSECKLFIDSSK